MYIPTESYADAMVTRDCSPIFANVVSNSISLNIRCDEKTEERLVLDLAAEPWRKECQFAIPESWYAAFDGANSVWEMAAPGTSYFSRFDFGVGFGLRSTYWTEEDEMAANSPEAQAAAEAPYELLIDAAGAEDAVVDKMNVRIFVQMEDGSELQKGSISVAKSSNIYTAKMEFEDQVNAYPRVGDEIPGVWFSCFSDTTINLMTFKSLCKTVIEKTTLSKDFQSASCDSDSGDTE
ncbi:hypothetical protein ACWTU6_14475 [Mesorhizobium sp. BHbsci]